MWAKMDRTDRITKQEILDFAQENGFRALDTELEPGDSYLAGRNTEIQLLTCDKVFDAGYRPWVQAVEMAYSYDLGECVKVELPQENPNE